MFPLSINEGLVCGAAYLEEDHVDECDEDGGRTPLRGQGVPLEPASNEGGPLVEHEQRHVPEHEGQEDDLRDELADDVHLLVEVLAVEEGDGDPEQHVDDAEDDGDLHLEGVEEHDLVNGDLPHGVDAEGVGGAVVPADVGPGGRVDHDGLLVQDLVRGHRHLPGGPEQRSLVLTKSMFACSVVRLFRKIERSK